MAILIDLENILHGDSGRGELLSENDAADVLERCLRKAGPADYTLAIAPAGVLARYAAALAVLKVPSRSVRPGPDAADLALLEQADHLASIGFTRFILVSADHLFSALCDAYPTRVIVPAGQEVSHELHRAATEVVAS